MNDASEADEEAESTVAEMQETPDSLREAVIAALGRSSPLLKSGLASSLPWRVDETRIVIPFRSGMEESVVRGSIADIAAKASELTGRWPKIELKVEQRKTPLLGEDSPIVVGSSPDPVAIVERVFRGTRLPDKPRGERDELH